jgi:hypothetical protein
MYSIGIIKQNDARNVSIKRPKELKGNGKENMMQ